MTDKDLISMCWRAPRQQLKMLRIKAAKCGVSMANIMRRLLSDHLMKLEKGG